MDKEDMMDAKSGGAEEASENKKKKKKVGSKNYPDSAVQAAQAMVKK